MLKLDPATKIIKIKLYSIRLFSLASFPFPRQMDKFQIESNHPKFFYPFVAHSVTNLSPQIITPQITMSPQRMGYGDLRDLL